MIREASDTTTRTQRARIWDNSTHGLTIGHLREFLDQVNLTDLDDDARVRLSDELQVGGSWHTVEITATRAGSETVDLHEPQSDDSGANS